ncbi:MAG: HAD-IIIC family phosphatase [Asgard group archaeon]|nr:HAD-IIIC family phosphatase [Asgard group archaeon]
MNSNKKNTLEIQKELLELVRKEPSYSNYWNVYKRIQKLDFSDVEIEDKQKVRIALLSSFTIDPLATFLDVDCRLEGLFPELYIGPFNRYQDLIINQKSELYDFNADVIFFFVRLESLLNEDFKVKFARMSESELEDEIERIINHLNYLLTTLTDNTNALVVFSNFIVPVFSPLGIQDNKRKIGMKRFYKIINDKLEKMFRDSQQVFIFDFDESASKFGKEDYINYPNYYRGAMLLNEDFLPTVSYDLMGYIKALKGKSKKCIVLDLDNTLWGGIIGEDGMNGIKLNPSYPGNEYIDFQKTILSFYNRGVILAVNSKNNEADALEVFQDHPYMQIQENHLASYRINWQDKVQNLIELANDINIGIDSMVFFDDNPVERARVKESIPEVLVVEMPESSTLYRKTLESLNDFDLLSLTKEDLSRGELYYKRRKRKHLKQEVQDIDEFIKTLEIVATIKQADSFSLPRVTALLNKTNQFNLTTKRYTATEVEEMHTDNESFNIYTLHVEDKFGDEGIVGVALIRKDQKEWVIDSFLMSCRVIGRKVETAFLYKVINDAVKEDVEIIKAKYIPTKKNPLVKDFFKDHDFKLEEELDDGTTKWTYKPKKPLAYPQYLQVKED